MACSTELFRGADVKLRVALVPKGYKADLVPFTRVLAGVDTNVITVVNAAAGTYSISDGTNTVSYVATATDTVASIKAGLLAAASASLNLLIGVASAAGATITAYAASAVTVTVTAPAVGDLTVTGTIASPFTAPHPKRGTALFLTSAMPAGALLVKDAPLGFSDAQDVPYLAYAASAGNQLTPGSILYCRPLDFAFPAGLTIESPYLLAGRESQSFNEQGSRVTSVPAEAGGYVAGVHVTNDATISANGNYTPSDAGFKTAELAHRTFAYVQYELEFPNPDETRYSKGELVRGCATVDVVDKQADTQQILKANMTLSNSGQYLPIPPAPLP